MRARAHATGTEAVPPVGAPAKGASAPATGTSAPSTAASAPVGRADGCRRGNQGGKPAERSNRRETNE